MGTTGAPYNIPYLESSTLLRDIPAADEAQAEAVADALDAIPVLAGIGSNVVSTTTGQVTSTAATSFVNVGGLSVTITPSSANSKILIFVSLSTGVNHRRCRTFYRLRRGGTPIAVQANANNRPSAGAVNSGDSTGGSQSNLSGTTITFLDSPNTSSPVSYNLQMLSGDSGTSFLNRSGNDAQRSVSTITAIEVAA